MNEYCSGKQKLFDWNYAVEFVPLPYNIVLHVVAAASRMFMPLGAAKNDTLDTHVLNV